MSHTMKSIELTMLELKEITTDIFTDEQVKHLDKYFFSNPIFLDLFSKGIGGFGHHRYIGGLAHHTLSVVYWTKELVHKYNAKYKELAILAAKLHDIGKIYEYSNDGTCEVTFQGEMEGHIVIGIAMLEEAFSKDNFKYTKEFKDRIKGCVVQHHGMPEYGSPQRPNTEEAYMIHFADYMDATMNKIADIKEQTPDNSWSKYIEELKTKLFI